MRLGGADLIGGFHSRSKHGSLGGCGSSSLVAVGLSLVVVMTSFLRISASCRTEIRMFAVSIKGSML